MMCVNFLPFPAYLRGIETMGRGNQRKGEQYCSQPTYEGLKLGVGREHNWHEVMVPSLPMRD